MTETEITKPFKRRAAPVKRHSDAKRVFFSTDEVLQPLGARILQILEDASHKKPSFSISISANRTRKIDILAAVHTPENWSENKKKDRVTGEIYSLINLRYIESHPHNNSNSSAARNQADHTITEQGRRVLEEYNNAHPATEKPTSSPA